MDKQMERVMFLSSMVKDLIDQRLNYKNIRQKWNEDYDKLGSYRAGSPPIKPSIAEIKRIMLVLRKESIKLDRMMTNNY